MLCHDHFHMKQSLQETDPEKTNYKDFVLSEFHDHFPEYLETWEQLYERSQFAKGEIQKIMGTTDKKVGLISHGYFIKCLTGDGISEDDKVINGIDINNC